MKRIMLLGLLMCGCTTYSITMIHTEGTASDVVDEDQDISPKIDPSLTIPAAIL